MKTLNTKYGVIYADEVDDTKVINAVRNGEYPNEDIVELLIAKVTKDSVFLDVGANIGTVAIPLSKYVKEVHCFEPIPRNLELLEKNIAANNITNILVHPYALSDKSGKQKFFMEDQGNAGTYRWGTEGSCEVKTKELDSFSLSTNVIKIDVQGMECLVLLGGEKTIEHNKPVIYFEVFKGSLEIKNGFKNIHKVLRDYNFFVALEDKKKYGKIFSLWLITLFILPGVVLLGRKGSHFDVLALPKDQVIDYVGPLKTHLIFLGKLLSRKFKISNNK